MYSDVQIRCVTNCLPAYSTDLNSCLILLHTHLMNDTLESNDIQLQAPPPARKPITAAPGSRVPSKSTDAPKQPIPPGRRLGTAEPAPQRNREAGVMQIDTVFCSLVDKRALKLLILLILGNFSR